MPRPTATAGVVGVPCSSATNLRDSGAGWVVSQAQNPPEVPPYPRGDAVFIERGAAGGMQISFLSYCLRWTPEALDKGCGSGQAQRECDRV